MVPFRVDRGAIPGSFRLVGELDVAVAELLDTLVQTPPQGDLRIDLSGLAFMDSSGLRALIKMAKGLRDRGAKLVLEGSSGEVARLLQLVRADTFPGVVVIPALDS
ncbi:MAG TPA: STAS domain-containing protein [Actinomycetota bacterium]|nr:STAS domain-containing protein [Actinomycetota bacterium]